MINMNSSNSEINAGRETDSTLNLISYESTNSDYEMYELRRLYVDDSTIQILNANSIISS